MNLLIDNIKNYSDEDFAKIYNNVKDEKKRKIDKFIVKKRKEESLLGEYLLIKILKQKYNINYDKIVIKYNEYGKPYIDNLNNIFFNISHSNGYVVCIVDNVPIGIDIEIIRNINMNIINQFATKNEINFILSNTNKKFIRAFMIYTLKEAYFKMLGTNLNEIKNIEFYQKQNQLYCLDKSIEIKKLITKEYIVSICKKIY